MSRNTSCTMQNLPITWPFGSIFPICCTSILGSIHCVKKISSDGIAREGAHVSGQQAEAAPASQTAPGPTGLLPGPVGDLFDDEIEEVGHTEVAGLGTGGGDHPDIDGQGSEHEDDKEDQEEDEEEEEETKDRGWEETVDATEHWTDEEAEAALVEVCRRWIAWQGYVRLKQLVWREPQYCGQWRPLSSRRLEKIKASVQLKGLVAEVQAYLLNLQDTFACSAALWFESYRRP